MLGKLIKYEFKSLLRIFLPLYAVMIALSSVIPTTDTFNDVGAFVVFALVVISTSIFIGLAIFTILRFNSSLFGDEGYLMFTLPVKVETIILSKALTMFFYYFIAGLSGFISLSIILFRSGLFKNFFDWNNIREFIVMLDTGRILLLFNSFMLCIFSVLAFIFTIYASISVGHIMKKRILKYIVAFVFYFVVSYLFARLAIFIDATYNLNNYIFISDNYSRNMNIGILLCNLYNIVRIIIMFTITTVILKNKLNLD